MAALAAAGLPVVPPTPVSDAALQLRDGLAFTIFPAIAGRIRDRDDDPLTTIELARLGRIVGRMHAQACRHEVTARGTMRPATLGRGSLDAVLARAPLPATVAVELEQVVDELLAIGTARFAGIPLLPVHADLNPGNLLWAGDDPWLIDFDDLVMGPAVQDLWQLAPRGADAGAGAEWDTLLGGYAAVGTLPPRSLALVPVLRALRVIWFLAWVAARYEEPPFQALRPRFREPGFWAEELAWFRARLTQLERTPS